MDLKDIRKGGCGKGRGIKDFLVFTKNAWIVMFDGAYVLSYYKSNLYYVSCIRG